MLGIIDFGAFLKGGNSDEKLDNEREMTKASVWIRANYKRFGKYQEALDVNSKFILYMRSVLL